MSITSQFTYTKEDILKAQTIIEKRMEAELIDKDIIINVSSSFQMLISQLEVSKCDTILKKEEKVSSLGDPFFT